MKKQLLLVAFLFIGSLAFAQTKEHKTFTNDFDMGAVGDTYHVFPCVFTVSYYQNELGQSVYDGPFSIIGEGRSEYVSPMGWGGGESKLSYEAHGMFKDGKLDGKLTITRREEFKSNKGEDAPRYWTFTGCFDKGFPSGKWDYSYFTTIKEMNNPKAKIQKEVLDSFNMTFKNGYPVEFNGFCIAGRGEFSHGLWGEVFKLNLCEIVPIKGKITEDGKPNGDWMGIIENKRYQNGMCLSSDDVIANDLTLQYLSGKIGLEEIEDRGYVVDNYTTENYNDEGRFYLNMTYFGQLLKRDYILLSMDVFKNGMELNVCDDSYWENTIKGWGCIYKKNGNFWTPSQVNNYCSEINRTNSYEGSYESYGLLDYYSEVKKEYSHHSMKTVHYRKIMAALDEKKATLEGPLVEELKNGINSQTSMVDLNEYMKSKSDMTENFADGNKKAVNDAYKLKFAELEKKEFDAVMDAIKGNFDNEVMKKILAVFPTKDLYKAFGKDCKSKIDEALAKQPQAIEASTVVRKAFDQIVMVSQNKKISKKPVDVISADYSSNSLSWEVFSGQSVQEMLPVKIAPFCPMSGYKIVAADYLPNGGFSYTVEWTQQISKKEQKTYISNVVLSKDKKHVELDSFDFSKTTEK